MPTNQLGGLGRHDGPDGSEDAWAGLGVDVVRVARMAARRIKNQSEKGKHDVSRKSSRETRRSMSGQRTIRPRVSHRRPSIRNRAPHHSPCRGLRYGEALASARISAFLKTIAIHPFEDGRSVGRLMGGHQPKSHGSRTATGLPGSSMKRIWFG